MRRCWGFRRFRRCGRIGDWRFYCADHRWQPLQGFAILFSALGVFASIQSAGWLSMATPLGNLSVRISDTRGLKFEGGRVVLPLGHVRGITSAPQARVFLLMRVLRACWGFSDCVNYAGPRADRWRISEARVDAVGNWEATPCSYPFLPAPKSKADFEYWELSAIATDDAASVRRRITRQTCEIGETDLAALPFLVCSETAVVLDGQPTDYTLTHPELAPQPRQYCFGRESTSAWVRLTDTSQVKSEKKEASDGTTRVETAGVVKGAVSLPPPSVFVFYRSARRCFHAKVPVIAPAKGAAMPTCDEQGQSGFSWSVMEAAVDAAGGWSAQIFLREGVAAEMPWVEFWQIQAVATHERQAILDAITPFGSFAANGASDVAHVICSDSRVVSRSEFFSGYWRAFEPKRLGSACE